MSRKRPVVAIDGPAGAGKTTVTRRVAEALGYTLVDTGALYRTVALAARQSGVPWDEEQRVSKLAHDLAESGAVSFEGQHIFLQGTDVSRAIRTQEIAEGASQVSALPGVRAALLDMQRSAGAQGGVVLEGRDIGTVVFPDAEAKFYLTASVEVRAERRYQELRSRGAAADLSRVREEVVQRDKRDTMRPVAPLAKAEDAMLVDSSSMSIDEVVELIVSRAREVARKLDP